MLFQSTLLLFAIACALANEPVIKRSVRSKFGAAEQLLYSTKDFGHRSKRDSNSNSTNESSFDFNRIETNAKQIVYSDHPNVVLVLGNTGTGKSTLVQLIAGNNSNMISERICLSSGNCPGKKYKIIDMNGIIGQSPVYSHTSIPQLVFDVKTNTSIYDCPGFSDTRSAEYDISGAYFIRKIANRAKKIKFIFVVNYSDLTVIGNRIGFTTLLTHVINMFKNITKFKDSFAIVANKVDDTDLTDNDVIATVVDYLQKFRNDLIKQGKQTASQDKKKVDFINALLAKNGKNYTKIGFLRTPKEAGPLSNISAIQGNKRLLLNLLHNNIRYSQQSPRDYGYLISDESKNFIHGLVAKIDDNILSHISNVAEIIQKNLNESVEIMLRKVRSIVKLKTTISNNDLVEAQSFSTRLNRACDALSDLVHGINDTITVEELSIKIDSTITVLDINVPVDILSNISVSGESLSFLTDIRGEKVNTINSLACASSFKSIIIDLIQLKRRINDDVNVMANSVKNLIKSNVKSSGTMMKKYFISREKTVHNLTHVSHEMKFAHTKISKIYRAAENSNETRECIQRISDHVKNLNISDANISTAANTLSSTIKYGDYIKLLNIVSNQPSDSFACAEELNNLIKYLDESQKWYQFLEDLSERLSDCRPNQDITSYDITNMVNEKDKNKKVKNSKFEKFLKKLNHNEELDDLKYHDIKDMNLDEIKLESLRQFSIILLDYYVSHPFCSFRNSEMTDDSVSISDLYDASGFYNELFGFENLFYKLRNKISFLPFYESLFTRICQYMDNIEESQHNSDDFKILKYLRAASLSKIYSIKNHPETYLIVDIENFFQLVEKKIKQYEDLSKESKKNDYKEDYRKRINAQITEAMDLIERDILPEIDNTLHKIDENIDALVDETISLKNSAVEEKDKLRAAKKKLEDQMVMKSILGVISVGSQALAFCGPHGAAAAGVIGIGTSIAEGYLDQNSPKGVDISQLPASVGKVNSKMSNLLKDKEEILSRNLVEADNELSDFLEEESSPEIESIKEKISTTIKALKEQNSTIDVASLEMITDQKNQILKFTEEQEDIINSDKSNDNADGSEIDRNIPIVEEISDGGVNGSIQLRNNSNKQIVEPEILRIEKLNDDEKENNHEIKESEANSKKVGNPDIASQNPIKESIQEKDEKSDKKEKKEDVKEGKKNGQGMNDKLLEKNVDSETNKNKSDRDLNKGNSLNEKKVKIPDNETPLTKKVERKEKINKVLGRVKTVMSMGKAASDVYSRLKKHKAGIHDLDVNIQEVDDKIRKLDEYESSIYKIIIPMADMMNNLAAKIEKNSEDKSQVALAVSQWKIQDTMKDVQFKIREMTDGFEVQGDLIRCIEKFEFAMITMIQIYDHVQLQYEKKQLTDYIADINSGFDSSIKDEVRRTELLNLKKSIKYNQVIQEYGRAINAFKQFVFPFADSYLGQFELDYSQKNITISIEEAVEQTKSLREELSLRNSVVDHHIDTFVHSETHFNSYNSGPGPFFVWDQVTYQKEITDLLKGKEILITADIRRGIKENAVMFKKIDVHLKALDETVQQDLDILLESVRIEITHLGDSFYRCGDKIYVMSHAQQRMSHYVYLKNRNSSDPNDVETKIRKNPPILSPYTMWKIKLQNADETIFEELIKFNQSIDLQLFGSGRYVEFQAPNICNAGLEKYYKVAGMISTKTNGKNIGKKLIERKSTSKTITG